ncbi:MULTISPECIES: DUF4058 family protein [Nostocales]|uniref:Uncharacterized protein n=3 Tax=Nostocales TaxID=1161 RepID=A0A0C1QPM1_9CYAN|nr:DUF4058 family protein [Tolypothrix bouteillei]
MQRLALLKIIEVLSPTNKRPGKGRNIYEQKRQEVLGSQTHFNQLSGDHLENLLCIYKDVLANSSAEVGRTCMIPDTDFSDSRTKGCSSKYNETHSNSI